jgi:hypothetical protein
VFRTGHFYFHPSMNTVCITLDSERLCNIGRPWSKFDLFFQYLAKWPLILIEAECNNVVLVYPFNYNAHADIAKSILRSSKCTPILQMISVVEYSYFPDVTHAFKFEVEIGCDYQRAGRRMLATRAYVHSNRPVIDSALELKVQLPMTWESLMSSNQNEPRSYVGPSNFVQGHRVVTLRCEPLLPVLLASRR